MSRITIARLREVFILDRTNWVLIWEIPTNLRIRRGDVAGGLNDKGYRVVKVDGRSYGAHILIYAYIHGKFPPHEIDHKNHIRDDNDITNLLPATHAENSKNVSMRSDNTSGVTGVYWDRVRSKWKAQAVVKGKHIHLGYFTNKKEAIRVRKEANIEHNFHANHGKHRCK